jgi:drug/metabolite transporter (DMT)-like permease
MSRTLLAHIALAVANILYGLNYAIAKVTLPAHIKPLGFVLVRVVVATAIFWVVQRLLLRESIARRDIPLFIACALTGVVINQGLFFYGLARTTEINAALIMITTPVLVLGLAHLILGERITGFKVGGIVLGITGATLLIVVGNQLAVGQGTWVGDTAIFLNATSYALFLVIVKPLMARYHPLTVITWVFLFSIPFVVPLGLGEVRAVDWSAFTPAVWGSVAFVVLGTTLVAYWLNMYAMRQVNPSVVSIYIYAQPLIASLVALAIGSDRLTTVKIIAGMLIVAGVYLASQRRPASLPKT